MLRLAAVLAAAGFALMALAGLAAVQYLCFAPVLSLFLPWEWAAAIGVSVGVGLSLFASFALGRDVLSRFPKVIPQAGHCPKCGYNLTGNTSGVCPECGAPAEMATSDE